MKWLTGLNPAAEAQPPPRIAFAEAEALMPQAVKLYADKFDGGLDIKLAFLVGRIWDYERNINSGKVVARGTAVTLYVYNKGLEFCHYILTNMWQQDLGGGKWGEPYLVQVDANANTKLTCDSIDRVAKQHHASR
jgi:hypothetical protein